MPTFLIVPLIVALVVIGGIYLANRKHKQTKNGKGKKGEKKEAHPAGGHHAPAPFSREAVGAVVKFYLLMMVFLVVVFVYHRLSKHHPDGWYLFLRMNAAPAFWLLVGTFWVSRWIRPSLAGLADVVAAVMALFVLDYLAAGYEDKFIGQVIQAMPGGTVLFPYQFRTAARKPVAPEDYTPPHERPDPPPEEDEVIWIVPPVPKNLPRP